MCKKTQVQLIANLVLASIGAEHSGVNVQSWLCACSFQQDFGECWFWKVTWIEVKGLMSLSPSKFRWINIAVSADGYCLGLLLRIIESQSPLGWKRTLDHEVQLLAQHCQLHHLAMPLSVTSTQLLNSSRHGVATQPLPWAACSSAWQAYQRKTFS